MRGETTDSEHFLFSLDRCDRTGKRGIEWKLVVDGGFFFSWLRRDHMYMDLRIIFLEVLFKAKLEFEMLFKLYRTLYIHGHTKLDFTVWHTAIEKAAGTDGNALQDQQLSKNDVPIIVNSCIAFVTQYGKYHRVFIQPLELIVSFLQFLSGTFIGLN